MPGTSDLRQADEIIGAIDETVTVIDARNLRSGSGADQRASIEQIRAACVETGFFYIDHVFDGGYLLDNALAQMRTFFGLRDDDPVKQAVNNQHKAGTYGWMPLYGEPAYQPGTIAHVESFDCGREYALSAKALEGPNAWPRIEGFRQDVIACWDAMTDAGNAVLAGISEAAGLDANVLPDMCNSQQLNTMRLLHYPDNDVPADGNNVGIAAHTDFECITLIMQTRPGLELTDVDGRWYDAPAHDGRVVVLLDDMLERLTNGMFKATGHRVRNTSHERFSIVLFFAVNDDLVIEPMPQFVTELNPRKYSRITQRTHIDNEIERAVENRAALAT